ncbi:Metallo-dependent phosphatase [Hypoxylon rubiginosum]|uniref:Metallo-dependent phosphatase n=1 Tax=Hypoxylon rubiginosum TaxID=110542 RepID=A0ACC0DC07_9PEZI|nr:Metallo-dependent phosphatase [Hypoxylon rubiginosum]
MGLLVKLGLRRPMQWERPTVLDWILDSPLQALVFHLYLLVLWLRGNPVKSPRNKQPIKIVLLSDTHESIVENVPDGDLLIHCGDMVNDGSAASIQKQVDWLASLPHQHKVAISGNHDSWFDISARREEDTLGHKAVDMKGIHYLEHKSITLAFKGGRKLNIYGAPDIPQCGGPDNAFQYTSQQNPWDDTIPLDTEILVTHTPPQHHLDNVGVGCPNLLREIWRKKPKLHVFGHVHWGRGVQPIFWDECQKSYEKIMSLPKRGLILDLLPQKAWLDVLWFLWYGYVSVLWHWFMLGGAANGSVMVNAAMQHGTSGKLTKKRPITVEI